MHRFIIEREVPGASAMSAEELQGLSQQSCNVLDELGTGIQWVQSFVTGDKLYCIYLAENEDLIREHATRGGFPANRISRVSTIIDPTTASTKAAIV